MEIRTAALLGILLIVVVIVNNPAGNIVQVADAYQVNMWMSQPFYRLGDTVIVYWDFRCGLNGGLTLTFVGPYTASTGLIPCWSDQGWSVQQGYYVAGVAEPQDSGNWVVYGEFTMCTDLLPIECQTWYAQTWFTVESAVIIEVTLTVTRTRTLTEVQTSYAYTTQYVTKSSKVTATYTETVTAQAETATVTLTGPIVATECSPTVTTTLTLSQGSTQQTSGILQAISMSSTIVFAFLVLPSRLGPRKKEIKPR